jgi:antitoxin MazE
VPTDEDAAELTVSDEQSIVALSHRRFSLQELLAGITPENQHVETDWGKSVGKEIW